MTTDDTVIAPLIRRAHGSTRPRRSPLMTPDDTVIAPLIRRAHGSTRPRRSPRQSPRLQSTREPFHSRTRPRTQRPLVPAETQQPLRALRAATVWPSARLPVMSLRLTAAASRLLWSGRWSICPRRRLTAAASRLLWSGRWSMCPRRRLTAAASRLLWSGRWSMCPIRRLEHAPETTRPRRRECGMPTARARDLRRSPYP